MVVKSATKKKLMDLGIEEEYAHKLADDRKWDDVKGLSPGQIAQICGIDSGTSQRIHDVMASSVKSSRASAASTEKTLSAEEQCPELGGRRGHSPCRTTTMKPR
ncbi:MAG: hypothetical protein Ct9H90mP26_0060 [Methanobacteriota archaeon]|nr:MAG: hypothetical protein Ct9H90mP26_0060 [Euryarchaeota archaeon]